MTNQTIKVGVLPGAVQELFIEERTTVAEVLEMAGLDATGYDIRLDGVNVEENTVISADASVLVLVKRIKGNMNTIKVGVLPGQVQEIAYEGELTAGELLDMAGLSAEGYDVRLDGSNIDEDTVVDESARVLVLVKRIKGNMHTIKVGVLPGAVQEFALEDEMTVEEVLDMAGLDSAGYDIRLDGSTVELDDTVGSEASVLVLVKKIKGNF